MGGGAGGVDAGVWGEAMDGEDMAGELSENPPPTEADVWVIAGLVFVVAVAPELLQAILWSAKGAEAECMSLWRTGVWGTGAV